MIQTLLFVAGINTFNQTLFGSRLPAVIGASYTFVPTTISIIVAGRFNDNTMDPVDVRVNPMCLFVACHYSQQVKLEEKEKEKDLSMHLFLEWYSCHRISIFKE